MWPEVDEERKTGSPAGVRSKGALLMLAEHGAVETAKRLLAKSEPQTGLCQLWELDLLHESVEAVISDNPRFHQFFTPAEISEAHRRLEELDYFKKGK